IFNAPTKQPDLLEELRPKRTSPWIKWGITLIAWSIVIAAFMAPTPLHDKTVAVLEQLRVMAEAKFGQGRLAPLFKKLKPANANPKPPDSEAKEDTLPNPNPQVTSSDAPAQTQPDTTQQEPTSSPAQPSSSTLSTSAAANTSGDGAPASKA